MKNVRRPRWTWGPEAPGEARELIWCKRLKACLKLLGKSTRDINEDPKAAPWKAAIACHLKTRRLCRNGWIGDALKMGSDSAVSKLAKQARTGANKDALKLYAALESKIKE